MSRGSGRGRVSTLDVQEWVLVSVLGAVQDLQGLSDDFITITTLHDDILISRVHYSVYIAVQATWDHAGFGVGSRGIWSGIRRDFEGALFPCLHHLC